MHLVGFVVRIYHDARSSECHATFIVGGGIVAVAKDANFYYKNVEGHFFYCDVV